MSEKMGVREMVWVFGVGVTPALVVIAFFSLVFMFFWNAVMPSIEFWQALIVATVFLTVVSVDYSSFEGLNLFGCCKGVGK